MNPRRQWVVVVSALIAGAALCGVTGVGAFATGASRWRLQREVARQQGWAQAAPQVAEAARRWYGPPDGDGLSAAAWVMRRFQRATAQAGVQVASMKPQKPQTRRGAAPKRDQPIVLEATVIGASAQIEAFCQSLARELPGVSVEALTIAAQPQGITCRLRLAIVVPE